jgi:predicted RND superfamily exporter protein
VEIFLTSGSNLGMQSSLFRLYNRAILQNPWKAILSVCLVAVLMAMGLPNFKLDASADSLTLERDDDLNFSREITKRYGSDNFLIVTFSPKKGDLFNEDPRYTKCFIHARCSSPLQSKD